MNQYIENSIKTTNHKQEHLTINITTHFILQKVLLTICRQLVLKWKRGMNWINLLRGIKLEYWKIIYRGIIWVRMRTIMMLLVITLTSTLYRTHFRRNVRLTKTNLRFILVIMTILIWIRMRQEGTHLTFCYWWIVKMIG